MKPIFKVKALHEDSFWGRGKPDIRHFYVERESGSSRQTQSMLGGIGDAIIKIYCDKHKCD